MTDRDARTTLIFGGAKSGKSAFAEKLCTDSPYDLLYVATSPRFADDDEMNERIKRHVERRGTRWACIEEQIDLCGVLADEDHPDRVVLIDCMTMWLNNLVYHEKPLEQHIEAFLDTLSKTQSRILLISNEVGQGIVPETASGRSFRDLQGSLNQRLAARCDRVIEVRVGLPILLKPLPIPLISL
ncbi:bifunctional adenosylcobinamide kinase/adenosylcobinamide-phosphate guanylyltransferase [uncultured Cohaesibacter sp.]|uniref:bifunctional adenosylcobinamide kinase/adenosylcobinamide-phosphate guanylyltransferase n=1 Tax=uncultured Cohaesibacter sp. TaxID=1002546 RepID=UPI0029C93F4E|nr:bifunctional adenosylcobinamide kinase/adenosylcobinamide-phosphate guanylyltransferase [uncultured Cohaesibacter sp.]